MAQKKKKQSSVVDMTTMSTKERVGRAALGGVTSGAIMKGQGFSNKTALRVGVAGVVAGAGTQQILKHHQMKNRAAAHPHAAKSFDASTKHHQRGVRI